MSCQVLKPATSYSKTEKVDTAYKKQEVQVKGAKVETSLDVEALINALTSYKRDSANAANSGTPPPPKPKTSGTVTDAQGKAQLTYWIDQFGKLQLSCESKDQTVNVLVAEVTRLSKEVSKKTEIDYKTPVWNWIAMSILATLLIIAVLILTLRKN